MEELFRVRYTDKIWYYWTRDSRGGCRLYVSHKIALWEISQKQGHRVNQLSTICILHDKQEVEARGGVQQSHAQVPAGQNSGLN